MYMASGYLESADNTEIYLFHSGQPFTHGSDAAKGLDSMPATTTQLTYTWVLYGGFCIKLGFVSTL